MDERTNGRIAQPQNTAHPGKEHRSRDRGSFPHEIHPAAIPKLHPLIGYDADMCYVCVMKGLVPNRTEQNVTIRPSDIESETRNAIPARGVTTI
jgi:hypothetical protein